MHLSPTGGHEEHAYNDSPLHACFSMAFSLCSEIAMSISLKLFKSIYTATIKQSLSKCLLRGKWVAENCRDNAHSEQWPCKGSFSVDRPFNRLRDANTLT